MGRRGGWGVGEAGELIERARVSGPWPVACRASRWAAVSGVLGCLPLVGDYFCDAQVAQHGCAGTLSPGCWACRGAAGPLAVLGVVKDETKVTVGSNWNGYRAWSTYNLVYNYIDRFV